MLVPGVSSDKEKWYTCIENLKKQNRCVELYPSTTISRQWLITNESQDKFNIIRSEEISKDEEIYMFGFAFVDFVPFKDISKSVLNPFVISSKNEFVNANYTLTTR